MLPKRNRVNELRTFYRKYPTIKFAKGELVLQQDDVPSHVYGIKRGVIKVFNLNSDGSSQSISFEIIDDILPLCWAFSKTDKTLFYYEAYTDCELYVIDKDIFKDRLKNDIQFTNAMLERQVSSYIGNMLQVDALEKTRAYTKLAYTFRYLCLRYGREIKENHVKIYVPLTQQELANTTGLTRETTTLELQKLRKNKIISEKFKYYTVNIEKLNEEIDDQYNPEIEVNMLRK
jgi:CRP-like cAMP-binding protein